MFYYTFPVINIVLVPYTTLLYDSTAAARSFLIMSSLVCGLFLQTLSFRYPLRKWSGQLKSWEIGWSGVIGLTRNDSVPWEVMPEVFKRSVRESRWHLIWIREYLRHKFSWERLFCIKLGTPGLVILFTRSQPVWLISDGVTERQSL